METWGPLNGFLNSRSGRVSNSLATNTKRPFNCVRIQLPQTSSLEINKWSEEVRDVVLIIQQNILKEVVDPQGEITAAVHWTKEHFRLSSVQLNGPARSVAFWWLCSLGTYRCAGNCRLDPCQVASSHVSLHPTDMIRYQLVPKTAKHFERKLFLKAVVARGKSVKQAWNKTSSKTRSQAWLVAPSGGCPLLLPSNKRGPPPRGLCRASGQNPVLCPNSSPRR